MAANADDSPSSVGLADDGFWYCPLCYDALPDDPSPADVLETRYTSRQGLGIHLLEHDKTEYISRILEEVDPR